MTEKEKKALKFCIEAHNSVNQRRKYSNEPYWVHPAEVAAIVKSVGGDEDMVCAAFLHDTVEDTNVTLEQVRSEFGHGVASLVDQLTDVSKPEDGNRATRKRIDAIHTSMAEPRAKTVKLADLISNSKDIVRNDPDFAKVYMREKEQLLTVLDSGDKTLFKVASKIIDSYKKKEALSVDAMLNFNSFLHQIKLETI